MQARKLPDALNMIMTQHGWSQVNLARELGVSQSKVSRLKSGKSDIYLNDARQLLDRVGWEIRITPKTEGPEPVDRREFMTAVASVAFVPSSAATPYQDPEYVRVLTDRVDTLYHDQGSTPASAAVHRYIANTRDALSGHDRQLQAAVSGLARKASEIMVAQGSTDYAEKLSTLALDLAIQADNNEAKALAYMELSRVAIRNSKGGIGAMYAHQGLKLHDISDSNRAGLNLRLSRSLAISAGQERNSRKFLDQAHSIDGLPPTVMGDLIGGGGLTLVNLRDHRAALSLFDTALQTASSPIMRTWWLIHKSLTALRTREPLIAAPSMSELARLTPLLDDAENDAYLGVIHRASAPWTALPEIRDAREQLLAVTPPNRRPPS